MGPALPFIAIAATVVGTAVGAYGAISTASAQADARKSAAQQQQQQLLNQQAQLDAQARSQEQQAQAQEQQRNQALYQARIAQNNAQSEANNRLLAAQNAAYAEQAGVQQTDQANLRTRGLIGAQRAAFAANGLLVNEGSAAEVTAGTETLGNIGVAAIRDDAARKALGFRIAGVNAASAEDAANIRTLSYTNAAGYYDETADYYRDTAASSRAAAGRAGDAAGGVTYNDSVIGGYASAAGTVASGVNQFSTQWDRMAASGSTSAAVVPIA